MNLPVILTGLRANNDLHFGNYFGALLPMIDMTRRRADSYQVNLFVPDLHSFTTPIDHSQLQAQVWNNLRTYVAAGLPLDTSNISLYRSSYVPAHSELTWILDCFTGTGEMGRMTQFKDKSAKLHEDRVSVGLFNYPVLMAADILLYHARYVPVGDDQSQHLEFTRDIAERFNQRFGKVFTVPEPVAKQHEFFGKEQGLRIRNLQDPLRKMSKSDDSDRGVLFLGDEPTAAAKKIMSAATDSIGVIHYDYANQPGISNLLDILALLNNQPITEVALAWEGKTSYGDLKTAVAAATREFLGQFQTRLDATQTQTIETKLQSDEAHMNHIANTTLHKVQQAVGLRSV